MLTDPERAAFLESAGRVQQRAAAALGQARDAGSAVAFVGHLHHSIDTVVVRALQAGFAPDCKAGCAAWCGLPVSATDAEVFRIAQLLQLPPPPHTARVSARLHSHAQQRRAAALEARVNCGFLVRGQCSIYAVRPAACRKAHSLSVKHCEALTADIPQDVQLLAQAEALMAGTSGAYRQAGLPSSAHELNAAVLVALTDASALARWDAGEAVFAPD